MTVGRGLGLVRCAGYEQREWLCEHPSQPLCAIGECVSCVLSVHYCLYASPWDSRLLFATDCSLVSRWSACLSVCAGWGLRPTHMLAAVLFPSSRERRQRRCHKLTQRACNLLLARFACCCCSNLLLLAAALSCGRGSPAWESAVLCILTRPVSVGTTLPRGVHLLLEELQASVLLHRLCSHYTALASPAFGVLSCKLVCL